MSENSKSFGLLLAAIAVQQSVASFAYPVAKYGLAIIEPFTFAFYRFVLASVILLGLTRTKKYGTPIARRDWPKIWLLGILIIPLNQTLFLYGQSLTAAGHGAVLFATTPIWVYILAMIHLDEKFLWLRVFGIALALIGAVMVMSVGAIKVGTEYLMGDMIIVVSVVAWAYYTVLGKTMVRQYGALRLTAYSVACGSVLYFPFGVYHAIKFDYSQTNWGAWGAVAYMAVGLSLIVYVIWFWLIKYLDASRAAVYQNVQPIIASIVAYFWLGEGLGPMFILGGVTVLVGVVISEIQRTPRALEAPAGPMK
ncbi:MAG TPA: EamA family transporter [candidate division Zixibacteria bacterium]|nr:EamA family transporter [candidate division Zixibacteria bacterium]